MSTPRFLLDEHVWGGLIDVGQGLGVDILLVQTQLPEGTGDDEVLAFAASQERVLLTSNAQDFAPLVAEWFLIEREHWGVIIVPGQTDRSSLSRGLRTVVNQHTADSLKNTYRFIQEFVQY